MLLSALLSALYLYLYLPRLFALCLSLSLHPILSFPLPQAMLADTVGTRVAQHALQRSLLATPAEAHAIGMVDELCGAEALMQLAYDRLATFTRIPPIARAETKLQQRAHIAEMTGPQSVQ